MESNNNKPTELSRWIGSWMKENLKLGEKDIPGNRTFLKYGMDSVHAMMLVGDLEDHLSRRLSPTLAWDHPTPDALARYLETKPEAAPTATETRDLLERIDDLSEEEIDRLLEEQMESRRVDD